MIGPMRARPVDLALVGSGVLAGAAVGIACGLASALFLWLLDLVTSFRVAHDEIVYTLPVAGLAIGWVYHRWGGPIRQGTKLVAARLTRGGAEIPLRMAPMVLFGTVLTHLFGGSAGREGTAVQIGGSLADWLAHRTRLLPDLRRQLLAAGVAGGFGSVFGTPFAGIVFALELHAGHTELSLLGPALGAALMGDVVTRALGIVHTPYPQIAPLSFNVIVIGKWLLFALAVALTTRLFVWLTEAMKAVAAKRIPSLPLRLATGGVALIALWRWWGSDFLGLGVPTIVRAFSDTTIAPYAFLQKLVMTALTIGVGFLGGEVTPLFFVGATLGNMAAQTLQLPLALGAAVGLVAVFGSAAGAPLALLAMAVELFGAAVLPHAAVVLLAAYLLSGRHTLYRDAMPRAIGLDRSTSTTSSAPTA